MALKKIYWKKIVSERLTVLSKLCKLSAFSVMFFISHKTLSVINLVIILLVFKGKKTCVAVIMLEDIE